MNERIKELAEQSGFYFYDLHDIGGEDMGETIEADSWEAAEKFARLIIEETLSEVDERVYGRGENQWYYDNDKKWVRHHFGYGELSERKN
jgi:hypothetical protein